MKLLLLLALGGCALLGPRRPSLQDRADAWTGRDINDAFAKFGPPDQTFKMPNGNIMYSYVRTGPASSRLVDRGFMGGQSVETSAASCKSIYMTDPKGTILRMTWEGQCR